MHAIHPAELECSFADIGGCEEVVDRLKQNLAAMFGPSAATNGLSRSKLYQAPTGVLLYGPPGCGKTLIAKALACESGARFLHLPLSLLLDKWVGETEKYLAALFSLARKIRPCIIFIDEIDALCGRRDALDLGGAGWSATMKSQFLNEWDGLMSNFDSQILVLGATNRRQDIDDAFLRRMPLQLYIGLPNLAQREQILRILLDDLITERDFPWHPIAMACEGLSGSDLREVCRRVVINNHRSPIIEGSMFVSAISQFNRENQ